MTIQNLRKMVFRISTLVLCKKRLFTFPIRMTYPTKLPHILPWKLLHVLPGNAVEALLEYIVQLNYLCSLP